MPRSWQLALYDLSARRGRTALIIGAVALASSLIVAVSCAIASAQRSVDQRIIRFLGATDARIVHPASSRFSTDVLEQVRTWPEVAVAASRLRAALTLGHPDDRVNPDTGRPYRLTPRAIGIDFALERRFRPFDLAAGRMPRTRTEIVIEPLAAERLDVGIGQTLVALRLEGPIALDVVGIYERRKLGTLQQPRIYVDQDLLGELTDRRGETSAIHIILDADADVDAFCREHQSGIPEVLVLEPAARMRAGFDRRVQASRIGLTIASVLTFLSAAFIIVLGLTAGVTERQRQLALLRCIGARRRDLFAAQLLLGLAFAIAGVTIGVPLGLAMTQVLVWAYSEHLHAGLAIHDLGLGLAVAGSVAAGIGGGLYPAILAARVAPLTAMACAARPARGRAIAGCAVAAVALIAIQAGLMLIADDETRFWVYAISGLPALFLGWFLAAVPVLRGLTALLARPVSAVLRLPPDMLRGSILATPLRHGLMAGALMIGMALLVDAWANGVSIERDWLGRIRIADAFAMRVTGISPEQQRAIAELPFVESVCPIGNLPARLIGDNVFGISGLTPGNVVCVGFDAHRFFAMNEVEWLAGNPETAIDALAGGDSAIVAEGFLIAKGVSVGDTITLGVGRATKDFEIVGVVSSAGLDLATQLFGIRSQYMEFAVSCVFVDFETVKRVFHNGDASMLQMNLVDGISDEEAGRRVTAAAPGVIFRSGRWIMDAVLEIVSAAIKVQSTIAMAALLLAALAVGHVIVANIRGRRYEFGVLRAIGATRATVARLILAECAFLALTGVVVGTLFGIQAAWIDASFLRSLAGLPVRFVLTPVPILAGGAMTIAVTLAVATPAVISVIRPRPGVMVAAGRNE